MTGAELKARRLAKNLSRRALAAKVGIHMDTVRYWEAKPEVDLRGWGPQRMAKALGMGNTSRLMCARARARRGLLGVDFRLPKNLPALEKPDIDAGPSNAPRKSKRLVRVICGAKTRKGIPCRAKSEPGRRRCKFHGGMSTGPKTAEGKARIAEAQRNRWAVHRHHSSLAQA